jgi:hypothetical protein
VPCFLEAQDFPVNILADTSNIHAIEDGEENFHGAVCGSEDDVDGTESCDWSQTTFHFL